MSASSVIAAAVRAVLLRRPERPLVIAIDGGSGAGKSTLAVEIVGVRGDAIRVHSDDFFDASRSDDEWDRMDPAQRADACIDWRRLRREVLEPLLRGEQARWRPFDVAGGSGLAAREVTLPSAPVIVLDGIYSSRPELLDLIALTVLVEAPRELRRRRHDTREPSDETDWHTRWAPAEEHYLTVVRPPEAFDLVVDGSAASLGNSAEPEQLDLVSPHRRLHLRRGSVDLSVLEIGDAAVDDAPVMLVHGLAGDAREWLPVASATPDLAGWAVDLRGHGYSTRRPADVSREALVEDLAAVIETFAGAPVRLLGQSLGGVVALLTAARRPELVAGLVLVDASPARPSLEQAQRVRESLQSWPRPFSSHAHAVEFFGGGLRGRTWAGGLEPSTSGWWARFDVDVLVRMAAAGTDAWADWSLIICPTIVLRAEHNSLITEQDADRMRTTGPRAAVVPVAGSGHDIHLDQPYALRCALTTIRAPHG